MQAVVFAGDGKIRVDDLPVPEPGEGDALVRVTRGAICGSDLHLLDGKTPGMRVGGVIGHEFVGEIAVSRDGAFSDGERVLGSFLIACGRCAPCASRRFNFCKNRRALGLGTLTGDLDGAQAEYVRVPDAALNLKKLDGPLAALGDEAALFAGDVLTTGFYGAALAGARPGMVVCVLGAGPIGLFAAQAAEAKGARVILLDIDERRVHGAEALGLEAHVSKESPEQTLAAAAGGLADSVIEAVGSVTAFKTAMRCARDGGRVIVLGVYGAERVDLSMGMAWIRGLDIVFSGMGNIQGHWDEALDEVMKGRVEPTAIISHRLPLDRAEEGYELFAAREATKVVFEL